MPGKRIGAGLWLVLGALSLLAIVALSAGSAGRAI